LDSDDGNNDNCMYMGLTDNEMDKVWEIYQTGKYSINQISTELGLSYDSVDKCITKLLKLLKPGEKPSNLEDIPAILIQPKLIIGRKAAISDYNYQRFIAGNEQIPKSAQAEENETIGTFNIKTYKG
jgi:hypothetical protein